jgi:hypothetical protein
MDKDNSNKDTKKLLMGLLIAQGVSAVTVGKIMGMTQQNVSLQIPVSAIQKDMKRYEQNLRQNSTPKISGKAK